MKFSEAFDPSRDTHANSHDTWNNRTTILTVEHNVMPSAARNVARYTERGFEIFLFGFLRFGSQKEFYIPPHTYPMTRAKQRPISSTRRSRLCVFEDAREIAIISAAETEVVVARVEGEVRMELAPDVPALWLTEEERMAAIGSGSWDAALRTIGYTLVGTPHDSWAEDSLLRRLRPFFPTIESADGAG